jgi:hypothetical protein
MNLNHEEQALRDQVFWELLENYSIEIVEMAFERARNELGFFPKPAEIIEFIRFEGENKYLQGQSVEPDHQLEWMYPTEEGKALAKEYLTNIFDVVEKDMMKPKLKGKDAKEFEDKRKIAKEKAKQLLGL